jgi:hypothetical protein
MQGIAIYSRFPVFVWGGELEFGKQIKPRLKDIREWVPASDPKGLRRKDNNKNGAMQERTLE